MKALTNEQRRFSLETAEKTFSGGQVSRVNPITGPDKLMKVLQAKLQQDSKEDAPGSLGESPVVTVNTQVEVGGRKKASKTGAMLWRPGTDLEMGKLLVGPRVGQIATREIFESKVKDLVDAQRGYLLDDGKRNDFDRKGFAGESKSFERLLERDHALFGSLNAKPDLEQQQVETRIRLLIERWTKGRSSYQGTQSAVDGPQHVLHQAAWGAFDRASQRMVLLEAALFRSLEDGAAARLIKSQAAFAEYRDHVSKFDAKLQGGGKVGELVRASVAEGMTLDRMELLENLFHDAYRSLNALTGNRGPKACVLTEAQVALESKNQPLPKPIERAKEVDFALKEIGTGLGEQVMRSVAAEMEQLRSASIEASYTEWMRMPGSPRDRGTLAVQLIELRDTGAALLAKLDDLPGGSHEVKEGYARLVDVLSTVDGSLKRLANGKEP